MKTKRYRSPKQIPNTLRAMWGKLRHEPEDFVFVWGEGCHSADASFLHHALCHERYTHPLISKEPEKSLLAELEARGYDITTFQFSIRKKK